MSETIGIVIIQIIIGVMLVLECYFYFGKKSAAGNLIQCVPTPMKRKMIKVVGYAIIFLAWFYMRVMVMDIPYSKTDLIYAAILMAELIFAILLDHFPQQICENGIITHRGYMSWEQIELVDDCDRSEVIQLKNGEKKGYFQQVFCCENEKKHIEEYVKAHISYIEEKQEIKETETIVEESEVKEVELPDEENEVKETEAVAEESKLQEAQGVIENTEA